MDTRASASMMLMSGVYSITNIVNGRRYIGSTKNFKTRMKGHRSKLRNGGHHCSTLQQEWDEHGESVFVFEPILVCGLKDLPLYEQAALNACQDVYNILKTVYSNREQKLTSETIISKKMRRRWEDPLERKKMSEITKATFADDVKRARILVPLREAVKRPEVRARRSEISARVWADESRRSRLSETQKRRLSEPGARERLSVAKQKLDEASVRSVRELLAAGISMVSISKRLRISTGLICNINTGKSYAGVGRL